MSDKWRVTVKTHPTADYADVLLSKRDNDGDDSMSPAEADQLGRELIRASDICLRKRERQRKALRMRRR